VPIKKLGGRPNPCTIGDAISRTRLIRRRVSDGAERRQAPSEFVAFPQQFDRLAAKPSFLLGLAAASWLTAGCTGSGPAAGVQGRVNPTYRRDTGRLEKLAYDRNGDGREDAWAFMDGTRLLRAELDDNFDGQVDRREVYAVGTQDQRAGTPIIPGQGVLARVELLSGNGAVFRAETYATGVLESAEEDTDRDGRTDKWERYEAGALVSVALDTRRRGIPDRRVEYARDGGAPRIETIADGSGRSGPGAPR